MIKNKRLKPEVEKSELELFRKGQFVIEDEEKEDATAVSANPPEEKKVDSLCANLCVKNVLNHTFLDV